MEILIGSPATEDFMKTILKHGFMNNMTAYCPSCGCEFTYEQEDITTSYKYECDSPFLAA